MRSEVASNGYQREHRPWASFPGGHKISFVAMHDNIRLDMKEHALAADMARRSCVQVTSVFISFEIIYLASMYAAVATRPAAAAAIV